MVEMKVLQMRVYQCGVGTKHGLHNGGHTKFYPVLPALYRRISACEHCRPVPLHFD